MRKTKSLKVICITLSALLLSSIFMTGCRENAGQSTPSETQAAQAAANTVQTQSTGESATASSTGTDIGVDEATKISLKDAGLDESSVTFIKQKTDRDDRVKVYDIEFVTSDTKYEYEIDAVSGDILDFSKEPITATNRMNTAEGQIGLDAAKKAALTHAKLSESDVTYTKLNLDEDDGAAEYEIEFTAGSKKYEYSINAVNGDIIEYDVDNH